MAKPTGTMVDKMFPAGEDIELPGERKVKKKGGKGKWVVIGGAALGIIGGGLAYNALSKKDVTPANYPAEPIVDTRPVPKPEIPEGFAKKEVEPVYLAQKTEAPAPEIERSMLTDLAVVKDKTVYPNDVDKTLLGGYKYNFKDPEQVALAVVEGLNNRDEKLLKILAGGSGKIYTAFKILDYEVIGFSYMGSSINGGYLKIRVEYEGRTLEGEMNMFLNETENGDIRLSNLDFDF